jgi:hypothetical protein
MGQRVSRAGRAAGTGCPRAGRVTVRAAAAAGAGAGAARAAVGAGAGVPGA